MKDYKRSDYAANKSSKNIVYKSEVSNDVDITLEKFLASDPNLTVSDFERWKKWSDEKYKEDELKTRRETRNNYPIDSMSEILSFVGRALEDDYESNEYEIQVNKALRIALKKLYADKNFTEKMRARFKQYYFENLSTYEIAKKEDLNTRAISYSITSATNKLKKYFIEALDKEKTL